MKISGHKTTSIFRRDQIESTRDLEAGFAQLDAYLEREASKPEKVTPMSQAVNS